jgi:hypothetical protein
MSETVSGISIAAKPHAAPHPSKCPLFKHAAEFHSDWLSEAQRSKVKIVATRQVVTSTVLELTAGVSVNVHNLFEAKDLIGSAVISDDIVLDPSHIAVVDFELDDASMQNILLPIIQEGFRTYRDAALSHGRSVILLRKQIKIKSN